VATSTSVKRCRGLLAFLSILLVSCATDRKGDVLLARSMYSDMLFVTDTHSARVSSWDRSGGNGDFRSVSPGETLELADIPGAGVIRHVYFTVMGPQVDKPLYLQDLVLRIYWDGETRPSVEAPLGDFFGQGHGRINYFRCQMIAVNQGARLDSDATTLTVGFNSYFPMPFNKGARLTLANEGADPVGAVWYHIDYEKLDRIGRDIGRFHAQYRQERPTQAMGPESNVNICSGLGSNLDGAGNYVILEAQGKGNVAGYFLNVDNVTHTWYGEGDDMIFIDGETWPPSFHGTGTEEIFGGGACPNTPYTGPYTGYLRVENADYYGETTSYRFYVADPIRFQKSIRMTIEHGHANNFANNYSSTVFWYQTEPHAAFPRLPGLRERLPRRLSSASRDVPNDGGVLAVDVQGGIQSGEWFTFYSRSCFNISGFWTEPGDGSAAYRWGFSGLEPGNYVVSVWIPADPNSDHATNAPYTVHAGGRQYEATMDQSKDVETWRPLGTFPLDAEGFIDLTNLADNRVVADAVLLVPKEK